MLAFVIVGLALIACLAVLPGLQACSLVDADLELEVGSQITSNIEIIDSL